MSIKISEELINKIAIVVVSDGVADVEHQPEGLELHIFDNDYMKESLGIDYYDYEDFDSLWIAYQDAEEEYFNL